MSMNKLQFANGGAKYPNFWVMAEELYLYEYSIEFILHLTYVIQFLEHICDKL